MMLKTTIGLAFATACLIAIATMPVHAQMTGTTPPGYNGAQGYQGSTSPNRGNMPSYSDGTSGAAKMPNGPQVNHGAMSSSRSAHQNVTQSQRYDRTLETNSGFRQARMRKECGPITDPELRQGCLASFSQDEPAKGSSSLHRSRHG
jgi:hypothetical protein